MSLCCKYHLLCLGLGADCAPPIEIDQLFNGEVQRTIAVPDTSAAAIHRAIDSTYPAGDGWGLRIRSSADILDLIGAFQNTSGRVFEDPAGMMWACVEES